MTNWKKFVLGEKPEVELDPISKLIVRKLGADLDGFLKKSQGEKTEHIMDALSQLGRKKGFKSMSNRISEKLEKEGWFKKAEWLYDLHWFKENKPYGLTNLPLVVECEWDWIRDDERKKKKKTGGGEPDIFGAIKWDFQKLLVANADLRVMIFQERIKKDNDVLDKYFDDTIDGYINLVEAKFLFIAFGKDGFWYSEKLKLKNGRRKTD